MKLCIVSSQLAFIQGWFHFQVSFFMTHALSMMPDMKVIDVSVLAFDVKLVKENMSCKINEGKVDLLILLIIFLATSRVVEYVFLPGTTGLCVRPNISYAVVFVSGSGRTYFYRAMATSENLFKSIKEVFF